MPVELQYNKSSGFIEIDYIGEVTTAELNDAICRRIAIQKETGALGVLADASAVLVGPSTVDIFNIPHKLLPEQNANRSTLTAIVLPNAQKPRDMARFLETASLNRGWNMQAFDDRQSAVAWLTKSINSNKSNDSPWS